MACTFEQQMNMFSSTGLAFPCVFFQPMPPLKPLWSYRISGSFTTPWHSWLLLQQSHCTVFHCPLCSFSGFTGSWSHLDSLSARKASPEWLWFAGRNRSPQAGPRRKQLLFHPMTSSSGVRAELAVHRKKWFASFMGFPITAALTQTHFLATEQTLAAPL